MTTQSDLFGRLLRGAINSIAAYEGTSTAAVEDELGAAIGLSGGAIQRYKAGSLPPEPRTIQILAEAAIQRGYLGRAWLQRFLHAAQFPGAADLITRLVGTAGPTPLPTGTLAFLFTDIAGSTRFWEQEHAAMESALIRHDALLRQAIETRSGQVFKTVGDAVYAVFATAPDALEAAVAAQRAVLAEAWPTRTPLRVRMAIHVGAAQPRDGDYFGPPLNRVARLCAAGHGGQILLSAPAWELVRDHLPLDVMLRDLGERRLKDLSRPERIVQALAPDLPDAFPPLTALDHYRHNLPTQPTALIGREHATHAVVERLRRPGTRLLTLTGPGGIGKTRLALQAAADLLDDYPDGVWFVALATVRDPQALADAIATVLNMPVAPQPGLPEQLGAFLRRKRLLLVLDNFEQLVSAAPLVGSLLADAPGVQALITSRTVLNLYGEQELPVPPLELPDPRQPTTPERVPQYAALRLFIERARAVRPDFVVTNETAPVIAEICARLDGVPLAIELAAARSRLFPPRALLQRLDRSLSVLTGGAQDRPARHQTLRDTIAWSYDLLDIAEQTLFTRLGVFAGGWTLAAAEQVCGDAETLDSLLTVSLPRDDIAPLLESLVSKSLVRLDEDVGDTPRFTMLATIREFALERLEASGEVEALQDRHLAYATEFAETAEPHLRSAEQIPWIARISAMADNLEAALTWAALDRQHDHRRALSGLRLANACWYWWLLTGRTEAALRWLDAPWTADPALPGALQARALVHAATLAHWSHQQQRWSDLTARALAAAQESGDPYPLALALANRALAFEDVNPTAAEWDAALDAARQTGDPWVVVLVEATAGFMRWYRPADQPHQQATLRAVHIHATAIGDRRLQALITHMLGLALTGAGDHAAAQAAFTEQLALHEALQDLPGAARAHYGMGLAARRQGNVEAAQLAFTRQIEIEQALGNRSGVARCHYDLGILARSRAAYAVAQTHLQACRDLFTQMDDPDNDAVAMAILHQAGIAHERGATSAQRLLDAVEQFAERTGRAWIAAAASGTRATWELVAGDPDSALPRLEPLLAFSREHGHHWNEAGALIEIGEACRQLGRIAQADAVLREAVAIARSIHDMPLLVRAVLFHSRTQQTAGDRASAARSLAEVLPMLQRMDARFAIAQALESYAVIALTQAQPICAANLWGAAAALHDRIGAPMWPVDRPTYEQQRATLRAALGDAAFTEAWAVGQRWTLDEAVAAALEGISA